MIENHTKLYQIVKKIDLYYSVFHRSKNL